MKYTSSFVTSICLAATMFAMSCTSPLAPTTGGRREKGAIGTITPSYAGGLKVIKALSRDDISITVDPQIASPQSGALKTQAASHRGFKILHGQEPSDSGQSTVDSHVKDKLPTYNMDKPGGGIGVTVSSGDRISVNSSASVLSVENTPLTTIQNGRLIILPAAPVEVNLARILSTYSGRVITSSGGYSLVEFDMSKVTLSDLDDTLRKLNQYTNKPLNSLTVSSLNCARTIKTFASILTQHNDWVASAEFNLSQPLPSNIVTVASTSDGFAADIATTRPFEPHVGFNPPPASHYWWLKDPRVDIEAAWNYGMGAGVTVSMIDCGFHLENNVEFSNRINWDKSANFADAADAFYPLYGKSTFDRLGLPPNQIDHGSANLCAGFSEFGNGIGTAGSAPNSRIVANNCEFILEYGVALSLAFEQGADVVVFNQNYAPIHGITPEQALERSILHSFFHGIHSSGIPVLVAAHNQGVDCSDYVPSKWFNEFDNMIVVGGSTPQIPVVLPLGSGPVIQDGKSNHGAPVSVWAPYYPTLTYSLDSSGNLSNGTVDGTSFGTPYAGGVAALVLAAVKRLGGHISANELRNVMQNSCPIVSGSGAPVARLLNAKMAIESALNLAIVNSGSPNIAKKDPAAFTGVIGPGSAAREFSFVESLTKTSRLIPISSNLWHTGNWGPHTVIGWRLLDGSIECALIQGPPVPFKLTSKAFKPLVESMKSSLGGDPSGQVWDQARNSGISIVRVDANGAKTVFYKGGNDVQSSIDPMISWAIEPDVYNNVPIAPAHGGMTGPFDITLQGSNALLRVHEGYSGSYSGVLSVFTYWASQSYLSDPHTDEWHAQGNFSGQIGGGYYVGVGAPTSYLRGTIDWRESVDFGVGGPDDRASNRASNQQIVEMMNSLSDSQGQKADILRNEMLESFAVVDQPRKNSVRWYETSDGDFLHGDAP